jgi:hypothetical protein
MPRWHVQAFVDVFGEYAGWAHNALFISELASHKHLIGSDAGAHTPQHSLAAESVTAEGSAEAAVASVSALAHTQAAADVAASADGTASPGDASQRSSQSTAPLEAAALQADGVYKSTLPVRNRRRTAKAAHQASVVNNIDDESAGELVGGKPVKRRRQARRAPKATQQATAQPPHPEIKGGRASLESAASVLR